MGGEPGIPYAIIWMLDKRQRRSPEEGVSLDKPIRRSPLLHKEGAFSWIQVSRAHGADRFRRFRTERRNQGEGGACAGIAVRD